jgi:hypothetical protein
MVILNFPRLLASGVSGTLWSGCSGSSALTSPQMARLGWFFSDLEKTPILERREEQVDKRI